MAAEFKQLSTQIHCGIRVVDHRVNSALHGRRSDTFEIAVTHCQAPPLILTLGIGNSNLPMSIFDLLTSSTFSPSNCRHLRPVRQTSGFDLSSSDQPNETMGCGVHGTLLPSMQNRNMCEHCPIPHTTCGAVMKAAMFF